LEAQVPALAGSHYKSQLLGAQRQRISGEGGTEKMSAMGIDEKDHDETAESSCRPPIGAVAPGVGKGWNPDTHRWADEEYLKEIQGKISPGGAKYFPDGVHAGTENAHLDHDENGVPQAMMATQSGLFKVNPSTGEMKTAEGGVVNHADVLGKHLEGHAGGDVDKKTIAAMGVNHSEKHTGKGQVDQRTPRQIVTDVSGTPGGKFLGKLGQMVQRGRQRNKGKSNATGVDRQRNRRGTQASPLKSFLSSMGKGIAESSKDVAETLPGVFGGELARGTERAKDKQVKEAAKKVRQQRSAAAEVSDRINRVTGENQ